MLKIAVTTCCGMILLTGCATPGQEKSGPVAMATLKPTQYNNVRGTVTFTSDGRNMIVVANVSGLTPGPHGFHVHERGDCSAPDASSAGAHLNPDNKPHGTSYREGGHAGDLGNLTADNDGNAQLRIEIDGPSLIEPEHGVVGRSVVVHNNADDLVSQPDGNADGRVACGVITLQ